MNEQAFESLHHHLTSIIIGSCFDIVNDLGNGFLEAVYKNALFYTLKSKQIEIEIEKSFEIYYHKQKVGHYKADIVVDQKVLVELKCCKCLLPEHQAQVINYLKASHIPIGLLINFGSKQLQYKRLMHLNLIK